MKLIITNEMLLPSSF